LDTRFKDPNERNEQGSQAHQSGFNRPLNDKIMGMLVEAPRPGQAAGL
jgi:hypothetical protein